VTPKNKPLRKSSGRSSKKSTKLGRVLVESAKQIAQHIRGEIELPMKVVRVVPDVDVRAIREGQGLTRQQFAKRYGCRCGPFRNGSRGDANRNRRCAPICSSSRTSPPRCGGP
jgi:DNA-binding transcriptional regulator YiaG